MLDILGKPYRCCDGLTRRQLMQVGALSTLGLSLPQLAQASLTPPAGTAKAVILVNLIGGPSHIDMFDLKPQAPSEVRGEFRPIASSLPGLQVCEHLPRTAKTMHLSTLIRTHTHLYNTHSPYNMLTGYSGPVIVNNAAKLTDHPSIGAVMQHAGLRSEGMPPYVWMPSFPGHTQGKHRAGPYGGFLGNHLDPVFTTYSEKFAGSTSGRNAHIDPPTPLDEPRLPLIDRMPRMKIDRLNGRVSLLQQLQDQSRKFENSVASSLDYHRRQAYELLASGKMRKAFDLSRESATTRKRYGRNLFGSCMLTARRLIEAGVRFVGVTTESSFNGKIGAGQWDTHSNNFNLLKNFNLPVLDENYSALIEDLQERGMLDSTLVILMGEMGRTPKINKNAGGRDHWTQCGFILLTGGGVKRGHVHGTSDKQAAWPIEDPVTSADYVATVYRLLGIDPHWKIRDATGNKVPVALHGNAVRDVIA